MTIAKRACDKGMSITESSQLKVNTGKNTKVNIVGDLQDRK